MVTSTRFVRVVMTSFQILIINAFISANLCAHYSCDDDQTTQTMSKGHDISQPMAEENEIPVLYETQVFSQHIDESDSDLGFGINIALDGNFMAVAKGPVSIEGEKTFNSVELFELNDGSWRFIKHIQSPNPYHSDYFIVPAIDQDTLVVGAYLCSDANCNREYGAAYIYERDQGGDNNWGFVKMLDGGHQDQSRFGFVTAIDNHTIAINAVGEKIGGVEAAGAVYIYERNLGGSGNWGLIKRLESDNLEKNSYDAFGQNIALQNNTLIVLGDADSVVYEYNRDEGGKDNWGQVQKFHLPPPFAVYTHLAFDGNTILLRARNPCIPREERTNHLLFYEKEQNGSWVLQQEIETALEIGIPALEGNQAIFHSKNDALGYLYQRGSTPDSWELTAQLQSNQEIFPAQYGPVDLDAGRAVLGFHFASEEKGLVVSFETAEPINAGHAGAWFNPETSGQGQLLDIEPEKQFMFLAWFTYTDTDSDNPGEQRWLTAQGNYTGNKAELPVYETLGGKFDDPQAVTSEQIGESTVSLTNCSLGHMSYHLYNEDLSGSFPMVRAISGSGGVCEEQAGSATEMVNINPGMDGAWFDAGAPGQGFLIDAHTNPDGSNFIFVAWFTYGDETVSGQRWLTAQGDFAGSTAELLVYESTGGNFDDPAVPETVPAGTMNIDFSDCSNAVLTYSLTEDGAEGSMDIIRAIPGSEALCEELNGQQ